MCPTQAHIDRQAIVGVGETFDLTSEICNDERQRQVAVGIVVVYAEVGGNGKSAVFVVRAVEKFERYTSTPSVGDVVAV